MIQYLLCHREPPPPSLSPGGREKSIGGVAWTKSAEAVTTSRIDDFVWCVLLENLLYPIVCTESGWTLILPALNRER